ncbi:hypothetical protein B1756_03645 [Natrarchaeobaculum aegyptiacum]|uniref:Solute-binding protein family 5 domain-containing protein n=2 Tax=Natrarchaeobaculum aegyptiacum TaxID=745377 RepID=A0A2Z2HXP5_9EURY|nr:hypothetical protein B1756_03645 [Natrarchaeobaculum aegyptiacum]
MAMIGGAGCVTPESGGVTVDSAAAARIRDGLEKAGLEPPVETTIYANEGNDERGRWAQLVQHTLNETGLFEVEFRQLEWGQYEELFLNMADREENALVTLNLSGGWDPDDFVDMLFHSDNHAPNGLNVNHFADDTVDGLLDAGRAIADVDQRRELYQELQERLIAESPVSILRYGEETTVYRRDRVDGWQQAPFPGIEYDPVYAPHADSYVERSDGEELVVDAISSISNPDPVVMHDTTSNMATSLVYEGLLGVDFEGTPRPRLATDWEQLDETTYRFDLREDVTFHNGEEFTADHVQFSFDRYEGTPREADVFDWYDGVDVLGDHELELTLVQPYGPLETTIGLPIVPLATDDDLDLSETPVGTGPYEFAGRTPGEDWRLERFDDHWFDGTDAVPETPPVERIRIRILTSGPARQAALESGELDVSTAIPSGSLDGFESDEEYGVSQTMAGEFDFLIYPTYLEPFDRTDVRRGIDQLLPRERIVEDVYAGRGEPGYVPIPPLLEEYTDPSFEAYIREEYYD